MQKKLLKVLTVLSLYSCNTTVDQIDPEQNTQNFEKTISVNKAMSMYLNDQNTRLNNLGMENMPYEKRASNFDLKELKEFINNIEITAKKNNINVSGINFIFGSDELLNRTIFIAPSIYNQDLDYNESFTIENDVVIPIVQINDHLTKKIISKNENNLILSSKGYLSYNQSVDLFNSYQDDYIDQIKKQIVKDYYTKSIYYSLEEIKSYIAYLEKAPEESNLEVIGISLFFGVYDNNSSLGIKANSQTVFLAPISKDNKNHVLLNNTMEDFKEILEYNSSTNSNFASKSSFTEEIFYLFANEGEATPPPRH